MTELQNYRMTELQNDRMTDRTKTICPPIFDLGGIKIHVICINPSFTCVHFTGEYDLSNLYLGLLDLASRESFS